MEAGEEVVKGSSSSSSSSSSSRWNPTKEQVAILEGIYREGIRTPNAEQIQEITRRLRAFGGIQGKNVFYWFQNHKARQRQKMKHDERTAILARLRHRRPHPPPFPPPPPPPPQLLDHQNVVYGPYGIPVVAQAGASSGGFYYQTPSQSVYLPAGPVSWMMMKEAKKESSVQHSRISSVPHETLQLFPLQPSGSGVLQLEERSGSSLTSASVEGGGEEGRDGGDETIPFFNFFGPSSGQGN